MAGRKGRLPPASRPAHRASLRAPLARRQSVLPALAAQMRSSYFEGASESHQQLLRSHRRHRVPVAFQALDEGDLPGSAPLALPHISLCQG